MVMAIKTTQASAGHANAHQGVRVGAITTACLNVAGEASKVRQVVLAMAWAVGWGPYGEGSMATRIVYGLLRTRIA
jgi:hypothetical protein